MQYLIDQACVFRARAAAHSLHLDRLAQPHRPRAMFIACSDARLVPALLTAAQPGDLYELRTIGGVVLPYDANTPTGESRTIAYAVDELGVSDIVVCGHSDCEVVTAAMHGNRAVSGVTGCEDESAPLSGDVTAAGYLARPQPARHVQRLSVRRTRLADRSLRLHAWFHELDTGATLAHHPRASTFLPL
ncbi:carbonic anhydrase [Streptomyces humi]